MNILILAGFSADIQKIILVRKPPPRDVFHGGGEPACTPGEKGHVIVKGLCGRGMGLPVAFVLRSRSQG